MFALIFIIAYCLLYLTLGYLFPAFFTGAWSVNRRSTLSSLVLIIIATIIIFSITTKIQDPLLENRLQHALGGGFLSFFICFLAWRSSGVIINRFQFFFFSFLFVITLGVANEILEYFLQNYYSFHFAGTINDTWLDLLSNIIGIFIASVIFLPWIKKNKGG
ncbi:MAG: hypothetical protein V1704_03710 [Candidatus Vogelbacteria bacterium]